MKQYTYTPVLTIAGSDSGGGAGIQADLKTFSALGCFGTAAVTAITVQNTRGVFGIHSVPPAIVSSQIDAVMEDIRPAAVKIGMVHSTALVNAIAETLRKYKVPVVLDPVMVATSGDKLIEDNTINVLRHDLFPLADLVTPNLDEAQLLTGMIIQNVDDMRAAAHKLIQLGCNAVLVKGGHLGGTVVTDVYLDSASRERLFTSPYLVTTNTHGTGCTLSSAIASFRARGLMWVDAIGEAREYVYQALLHGKDVRTGSGNGPLNHFYNPQKLITHELE